MKTCPTCGYPVEECPWSREQAKQRRQLLGYLFWLGVGALVLIGVLLLALTCKGAAAPKYNIVANIIGDLSPTSKPIAHVTWYDRAGRKQHWDHAFDEDFKVLIGFGDQDLSPEQVVKIKATGTNGDTALGYFAPTQERVTLVWRRHPPIPVPDDEPPAPPSLDLPTAAAAPATHNDTPPPPPAGTGAYDSVQTISAEEYSRVLQERAGIKGKQRYGFYLELPGPDAPKGAFLKWIPDPPQDFVLYAFLKDHAKASNIEIVPSASDLIKARQAAEDEEKKIRQKRREAYEKLNVKPILQAPLEPAK